MSTAISSRAPRARLFNLSDVGTAQLLGGIIVLSFLGRLAAGWVRATPTFFPDEYLYAELGRSIAEGSGPLGETHSQAFHRSYILCPRPPSG